MKSGHPAILLLGDTLNLGGTEGQFVEVACRLDQSRWRVHLSCLRAEGPLRKRLEAAGLGAWSCGRGSLKPPRFLMAVWGLVRYLRAHRISLVHCFDFYSNILGVPAARLARVPVVIASQRDLGDLRPRLQQRFHSMVLRLADHVLVNSDAVAERMKRVRAAQQKRIVVIPNGVDLARFTPAQGRDCRSGRIIVGTLTNLRPEKGIADLVQAAKIVCERSCNVRFVIWGDGPLRADLGGLVHSLDLGEKVDLRGSTAEPELALRELDIFVLPSLSEACSNVLMEAMATGLPVIATRVGGNIAMVEHEGNGLLVIPGDPDELAKVIVRLVETPEFAAKLGAQGRDRIQAKFGTDKLLERVEALYEQALARSGN